MWQVIIPIAAIIVLASTLYRNVCPYPTGDGYWFPIMAGGWLLAAIIAVLVAPGTARRLGLALASSEGIGPDAGDAGPGGTAHVGRHRAR